MKRISTLLALLVALVCVADAQITVANKLGTCSTAVSCSLPLDSGVGSVTFSALVGPNCAVGSSCGFPVGAVASSFAYLLPDGTSATANNFSGTMTYNGIGTCGAGCSAYFYTISGTFSGQDSQGRSFTGSTSQATVIETHSRGGSSASDTGGTTTLTYTSGPTPPPPPEDFSLTVSPATLSVQTGKSAVVTLTLVPEGGFRGTQTFACSGLPTSASCSFNPSTLVADGSNTSISTQVTIDTSGTSAFLRRWVPRGYPSLPFVAGSSILGIVLLPGMLSCFKKRGLTALLLVASVTLAIAGIAGCGSSASSTASSTPPQSAVSSWTVFINATSSNGTAHTTSINLTLTN